MRHAADLRWLLALALCLASTAMAQVRTFVDPKTLDETESLRLTLRLDGTRTAPAPDLAPLEKDFEVLGSNNSSQYRSRNGRVQAWVEYQISLRPRRTGRLTIPSLTFGGERTEAVSINVRPLDPALRAEIDRMVFFETTVSAEEVYVQAELVYERRLYYATSGGVQMYSDLPGTPEVADAVVLPLGDPVSSTEQRDGIGYGVVAQRYALYPERAGTLTVPGVALTSSVRVLKNGRSRRSGVRVDADPVTVTVLPIPASYPADAPWLPARSVNLSQTVEPQSGWQTGDTVQRVLRAEVTGNVGSAIPPLAGPSDDAALAAAGLRSYPEPATTRDQVLGISNLGVREERAGLVALQPGAMKLPTATLTWWNTELRRVERSATNVVQALISGNPVVDASTASDEPQATDAGAAQSAPTPLSRPAQPLLPWPWLLTTLALVCALFLGWQRRHRWWPALSGQLAKLRAPYRSRRQSIGALNRDLTAALGASSPRKWRSTLIETTVRATGLSEAHAAARLRAGPRGTTVMQALDEAGYGPESELQSEPRWPTAEAVQAAFQEACNDKEPTGRTRPWWQLASSSRATALPPLYPERPRR